MKHLILLLMILALVLSTGCTSVNGGERPAQPEQGTVTISRLSGLHCSTG